MLVPRLLGWVPEGTPDRAEQLGEKCGWKEAGWGLQMDGTAALGGARAREGGWAGLWCPGSRRSLQPPASRGPRAPPRRFRAPPSAGPGPGARGGSSCQSAVNYRP